MTTSYNVITDGAERTTGRVVDGRPVYYRAWENVTVSPGGNTQISTAETYNTIEVVEHHLIWSNSTNVVHYGLNYFAGGSSFIYSFVDAFGISIGSNGQGTFLANLILEYVRK